MMTYDEFWQSLLNIYSAREAKAVARFVMEVGFCLTMTDIVCGKVETLDEERLKEIQRRLLAGEPVQYVLGQADFGPHRFHVAPGVLIPRPETYELCQLVSLSKGTWNMRQKGRILDIGTGSGCIACTLAAAWPEAEVTAWDISAEALRIAEGNANQLGVNVIFEQVDILNARHVISDTQRPPFDVIVSNPPYVCASEKTSMEPHVLDFEPALALFVPDDDPLCFYRVIGRYALQALKSDGLLALEINAALGEATKGLLAEMGFTRVELKKDQFGKDRFITAQR